MMLVVSLNGMEAIVIVLWRRESGGVEQELTPVFVLPILLHHLHHQDHFVVHRCRRSLPLVVVAVVVVVAVGVVVVVVAAAAVVGVVGLTKCEGFFSLLVGESHPPPKNEKNKNKKLFRLLHEYRARGYGRRGRKLCSFVFQYQSAHNDCQGGNTNT